MSGLLLQDEFCTGVAEYGDGSLALVMATQAVGGRQPSSMSAAPLEELNFAFVLFSLLASLERAEVATLAGLRIYLA